MTALTTTERADVAKIGHKVRQLELSAKADRAYAERMAGEGRMVMADFVLTIAVFEEKCAEELKERWQSSEGFAAGYAT